MKALRKLLEKDECQWNYVHFKTKTVHNARQKIPAVHELKNSELAATERHIAMAKCHNAYLVHSCFLDLNRKKPNVIKI